MTNKHDYQAYVQEALTKPGIVSNCYNAFWNYSSGNQWLAMLQLGAPQPINTYKGWLALGRQVKKGEKAIELLMPCIIKDKAEPENKSKQKMIFIARKNWFGLNQTEGEEYIPASAPEFCFKRAIEALGITMEKFEHGDGNCQGYARSGENIIAINPVAAHPDKTLVHEVAHCMLHGDAGFLNDANTLGRDVKEVEAELTAYLVCASIGKVEDLAESRGYIQHWLNAYDATEARDKVRFAKVFSTVDKILKAGRAEALAA